MNLMMMLMLAMPFMAAGVTVTFKVGMSGADVASSGLHVAGSFQDWDPSATPLLDEDADGIYEATLELSPNQYEFKFINGNTWAGVETVPVSCREAASGDGNRYIVLAEDKPVVEVDVCFAGCHACADIPACKLFSCPRGYALKQLALDVSGNTKELCCEHSAAGTVNIVARSAGFSDGNLATFWVDGQLLYSTSSRGLTVLVLNEDASMKSVETFDTYADSASFEAFLSGLPDSSIMLIAAADEASQSLGTTAKASLSSCGATLADGIAYRSSYALVGTKGGARMAEALLLEGSGVAVASSLLQLADMSVAKLPYCEARSAAPPVSGQLASDGNLKLDAGCQYKLREFSAASDCLDGTWVVVTGSSNSLLMFNTLLMMLAPVEADEQRSGRFGGQHLIDVVIEDGKIIHYQTVRSSLSACIQGNLNDAAQTKATCKQAYADSLGLAPDYSGRRIRVTMFLSFFWGRTAMAADLVEADQKWAAAQISFVVQVCAWYLVCQTMQFSGCPRQELLSATEDEAFSMFTSEMGSVLSRLEPLCSSTGRAGVRGCVIGTNSWSPAGGKLGAAFTRFNAGIAEAMKSRQSASLRYLDFFTLGAAMPEQTENGHGSQVLHLWAWQVMLGGMCHSEAASGWMARFAGALCWRQDKSFDLCPKYSGNVMWQCMNSVLCTLQVSGDLQETATTTTASEMTTTTTSSTSTAMFSPVDGGDGRACRGQSYSDNNPDHYTVHSRVFSMANCKAKCIDTPGCVGIEFSAGRCEVWTRIGGIRASIPLPGFTCLRYDGYAALETTTSSGMPPLLPFFSPVEGGSSRACRGASVSDNSPDNYVVRSNILSLQACQEECVDSPACIGVEFSTGRCEIWTRSIEASKVLEGFTCLRYDPSRRLSLLRGPAR